MRGRINRYSKSQNSRTTASSGCTPRAATIHGALSNSSKAKSELSISSDDFASAPSTTSMVDRHPSGSLMEINCRTSSLTHGDDTNCERIPSQSDLEDKIPESVQPPGGYDSQQRALQFKARHIQMMALGSWAISGQTKWQVLRWLAACCCRWVKFCILADLFPWF
jgi:hypothetical protein